MGIGILGMLVMLVVALAALALPIAVIILLVVLLRRRQAPATGYGADQLNADLAPGQPIARERVKQDPRLLTIRGAGIAIGLVVAAIVAQEPFGFLKLGRGQMLAPVALGLIVLAATIAGERLLHPPRALSGPRTASLASRRVTDYLPRTAWWVFGTLATTLALLATTTGLAAPDDLGRGGRQLAEACGITGQSRGPFPGSFYAIPLAAALIVAAAAACLSLVMIVRRPRGSAPTGEVGDDALRRSSAAAVIAALGIAVAAPTIGVCLFAGLAFGAGWQCSPNWFDAMAWLCAGLGLNALVLLCASISILLSATLVPSVAKKPQPVA